jgi:hypothetical protein
MADGFPEIPSGLDHLQMIDRLQAIIKEQTSQADANSQEKKLIGTSLCTLYESATCNRKCHGGPHVLEALCGRTYNLGVSAYLLIERGFYDEALNLVRSIGEAGNIISLSVADKTALKEWLECDRPTRLHRFSPKHVRDAITDKGGVLIADEDWYRRLCESYTHVTPQTKPNLHNQDGKAFAGGVFQ